MSLSNMLKFRIEILSSSCDISKNVENSGSIAIEKIAPPGNFMVNLQRDHLAALWRNCHAVLPGGEILIGTIGLYNSIMLRVYLRN